MSQEIKIDGLTIAQDVVSTIVARSVAQVEGVASVGVKDLASNLVRMVSTKQPTGEPAVVATVEDEQLAVVVRIVVFFGYPFKKLADAVRAAVADAVRMQIGVEVARVDVCIDGLVFPKE